MKCLQFQQFVLKRIKIPDCPWLVTTAGKSSNRTCISCRIISLSAMHLSWHGNLIILCQSTCHKSQCHKCVYTALLLSALINLPNAWARHSKYLGELKLWKRSEAMKSFVEYCSLVHIRKVSGLLPLHLPVTTVHNQPEVYEDFWNKQTFLSYRLLLYFEMERLKHLKTEIILMFTPCIKIKLITLEK
jgi:hypothetical protein